MSEPATTTTNDNGLGLTLPDEATDQRERWLWAAFLVILALVSFSPAIQGGFIWDDNRHPQNKILQKGVDGLIDVWVHPSEAPKDNQPARYTTPQYYPMTFTSYWIEYQLWGDNPMGYHAVNLLLHAGSALLLWEILRCLGVPGAWVGAALFAVHPIQVESVAWITERKNVLAGTFFFGSLLTYLKFLGIERGSDLAVSGTGVIEERKPDWQWYGISLALFVGALLSKTIACSLPVVIAILLWWKRGRVTARDLTLLAPYFVLGLIMGSVTAWMERNVVRAVGSEWDLGMTRLPIAGRVIWFYVCKLFVPTHFTFTYPRWNVTPADALGWIGLAAALLALAALFALRKTLGRGPLAAFAIYLVTLFPAMGFFNVYPMRYSFVADHFQYLSGVALLVLAAAVVATLLRKLGNPQTARVAGLAISAVVVLGLAFASVSQAQIYHSPETLWRDTIAKNPAAWMAHYNLGIELLDQSDQDLRDQVTEDARAKANEAVEHFQEALQLRPTMDEAYNNWGKALMNLNQPAEALAKFDKALELKPDSPGVYNNQGVALARMGRKDEAFAKYERAIEINQKNVGARYNLGLLLLERAASAMNVPTTGPATQAAVAAVGATAPTTTTVASAATTAPTTRTAVAAAPTIPPAAAALYAKAREQFTTVVQIKPDYAEAWQKLGLVLTREGRYKDAFDALNEAATLKPELAEAHMDLGALYARFGKLNEAGVEYTKASQLDPENASIRATLGFLAGQLGKTAAAKEFFEMALKLDPNYTPAKQGLQALARMSTQPTTHATTSPVTAPTKTPQ